MKKTCFAVAVFFIIAMHLNAQQTGAGVEVRLHLIDQKDTLSARALTLGVSIINHTGKNIFIPDFLRYVSSAGIRLFRNVGGGWKEFFMASHKDNLTFPCENINGVLFQIDGIVTDNPVTIALRPMVTRNIVKQKQLFEYFEQIRYRSKLFIFVDPHTPVFLEAGQELVNIAVYDLNWVADKPGEWNIYFDVSRTERKRFMNEVFVSKTPLAPLPANIGIYEHFSEDSIYSNNVYYTVADISLRRFRVQ